MLTTASSISSLLSAIALFSNFASASSFADVAPSHFQFKRAPLATVVPTSPGPGDKFNEGQKCTMQWTPGTGSAWKSMTISLMTGSNQAMTVLTNVATGLDGTTTSSYSWDCPQVSPNSAIYFYQFTDRNSANPTWTTRFTIASPSGESTTPTDSEQANGQTVLYGNGKLVSGGSSNSGTAGTSSSSSPSTGTSSSGSSSSSDGSAAAPAVTITSSSTNPAAATSTDSTSQTSASNSQTTGTTYPFTTSSGSNTSTSGASSMHMIQGTSIALTSLVVVMGVMM